ncbi:MAG: hypothetical protein R2748_20535 [Bryobacterales bacterium]
MRKLLTLTCAAMLAAGALLAQTEDMPDPSSRFDDIVAHLNLTDSQVTCLQDNVSALRDAAAPTVDELRTAQRALRDATRNGEDTSSQQAAVDALVAQLSSLRTTYIASAKGCLDSTQQAQLGELVAAETLMKEVREGIGLLLLESTEEHTGGFGGGRPGPGGGRGPGRGGR